VRRRSDEKGQSQGLRFAAATAGNSAEHQAPIADGFKAQLKILVINDCGTWVAQCLEYDLAAQAAPGESVKGALEAFNLAYWARYHLDKEKGLEPFSQLNQASTEYWKTFAEGIRLALRFTLKPPFDLQGKYSVNEVRLAA
jgi:hypothetical protein